MQKKLDQVKIEEQNRKTDSLFESYISAGDMALHDTLYTTAKISYAEALKVKPGNPVALLKLNNVEKALMADSIQQVNKRNEALYKSLIAIGDEALKERSYEQAKINYREALKIKPGDIVASGKLNAIDDEINRNIKEAALKKNDSLYSIYKNSADKDFKDSLFDIARAAYDSALKFKPGDVYAGNQLKKIDEVLAALQKQAEKNLEIQKDQERQNQYISLIAQADNYYNSGNYIKARETYNEALLINKNDSYSTNKIALIDKNIADAKTKRRLDSLNAIQYTSYITKADNLFSVKDYDNAKKAYKAALQYKNDDYPVQKMTEIEEVQNLIAARDQAIKDSVQRAGEINKQYAELIKTAGKAYAVNDFTTAKISYATAAGLKPNEPEPKLKMIEIDEKLSEIETKAAMQKSHDSLITNGEIALASQEFPLALDNFNQALQSDTLSDDNYYIRKQVAYIEYRLKQDETQRNGEEIKKNFDTALNAYNRAKNDLQYLHYENALADLKKFLSITGRYDSATLLKSEYSFDRMIKYAKEKVPAIEAYLEKQGQSNVAKNDSLPTELKMYGNYAPMLYYPNPKDPGLNYVYKKYPEIDFNASPPDQHFDSLLSYGIVNNLIGREIMALKPDLAIVDSIKNVKLVCQNIKFKEPNAYFKFLIMNYDSTEFLTGKMLLTLHKQSGDSINIYPNYVANYPIILPGRQKVLVYVIKSIPVSEGDQLSFKLYDRLNQFQFFMNIPGSTYNVEKKN
jgi:tetratricopeptide (TPR) repeat protein